MNEHYDYICYNCRIKSNVPLSFLRPFNKEDITNHIINLICFHDKYCENEKIYFIERENEYIIKSPFTSYAINVKTNTIRAYYRSQNELESTLYNLPFSIVAQSHNDILLHASSVEYGNEILAFCADKGVGKTTFVSHLSKLMNFFSDDTLYLTKHNHAISCFSSGIPLKMNFDTFSNLSEKNDIYKEANKSLQNKRYIETEKINLKCANLYKSFHLKYIYFLRRSKKKANIEIVNIDNEIQKKSLLLNNIVGISYLLPEHVKNIINNPLFLSLIKNIPFKYLDIHDNLSDIQELSKIFYNYIRKAEM